MKRSELKQIIREVIEESFSPNPKEKEMSPTEAKAQIKELLRDLGDLNLPRAELIKAVRAAEDQVEGDDFIVEDDEIHGKLNKAIVIASTILSLMTTLGGVTDPVKFVVNNTPKTEHHDTKHQTKDEKAEEKASLYSAKFADQRQREDAAKQMKLAQIVSSKSGAKV